MTKVRTSRSEAGGDEGQDWRHVVAFSSLVGSILGVLTIGAVLRTGAAPEAPAGTVEPRATPTPAVSRTEAVPSVTSEVALPLENPRGALPKAATPDVAPPRPVSDLASRALADLDRMAALGDGFTAQLAVLCEAERARAIVDRFSGEPALYVLPTRVDERSCFLLSWSHYDRREAAQSARDLPRDLRAIQPQPFPRRVAEIVH